MRRRSQGPHAGETWTHYVAQPTGCLSQLPSWYLKHLEKNSGKHSGRELIMMKLKPDVSCHLPDVYTRLQAHISRHVGKKSGKLAKIIGNIPKIRFLAKREVYSKPIMYLIWRTYLDLWGLTALNLQVPTPILNRLLKYVIMIIILEMKDWR